MGGFSRTRRDGLIGKDEMTIKKLSDKTMKRATFGLLAVLAAILIVILALHFATPEKFETTTYSMGTFVQQTVYGEGASQAASEAANAVATLEDQISWRIVESDVAKINEAAGKTWTQVSDTTYGILEKSLLVSEASKGAFDPTIAPLSLLWDFDNSPTEPPSKELVEKVLPYVDYTKLRMDPAEKSFSFKSAGYAVDLGGVGKGAACDEAVSLYARSSVDCAIIAVGGSVGTYGSKPFGAKWNIAVRDPAGGESVGSISIDGGFVSTSGNYEKYFEYQGKRYHHILDPKTGYPAESGLVSVTVVCDSGVVSDALSTACFVLGYEGSLPVLEEFGAQAIFIFEDNSIEVTEGLKGSFQLSNEKYSIRERA